jgi:hypothetical protein
MRQPSAVQLYQHPEVTEPRSCGVNLGCFFRDEVCNVLFSRDLLIMS